MAIISFYSLKIIFGHFTRCNWTCLLSMVFVVFFGGKWYKNGLFGATTHKNIDFTALNAGIRWEKNIYLWYHLYHHDHDGRLIPARYVVPQINQYFFFTFGPLFGSKSLSCCDPIQLYYTYTHVKKIKSFIEHWTVHVYLYLYWRQY